MAAPFKITTVKATPYRAEAEELWSNSYHFVGPTPADAATWTALANAVWNIESLFINVSVIRTHLVHGYGYAPGADVSEWSGDFTAGATTPGTAPVGGGATGGGAFQVQVLPVCSLLRFQCGISAHTGKPRYVMKYIHDVAANDLDETAGNVTAAGAAGLLKLYNGTLPGGVQLSAPDGTICTSGILSKYVTTHQIKRRGKRPRRGA